MGITMDRKSGLKRKSCTNYLVNVFTLDLFKNKE